MADEKRKAARAAESSEHHSDLYSHTPAEFDLPEFDPASVLARVQQQRTQ